MKMKPEFLRWEDEMKTKYARLWAVCMCSVLFLLVGCGEDAINSGMQKANANNIKKVSNAYIMFASINGWVGPKDEAELKNFILTDKRVAPRFGMSDMDQATVDGFFISDVDGEPFEVLYGLKVLPADDYSPLVLEKTGENGVRRVGLACSEVIEVTDDKKYQRMLAGKSSVKDLPAELFEAGAEFDDPDTQEAVEAP